MTTVEERQAALDAIAGEIRACTLCPLHEGRTNAVPGSGPVNAEVMFIGEGPGATEDEQGLPFVGASGRLLDELLNMIGMKRDQVFIANVVKCRPPGNRDPRTSELTTCAPYLDRQIELIDPKMIITLGRYSMARWFPEGKITQIHGQAKKIEGRLIMPVYHPAAALRNPSWRPQLEADFKQIPALIRQIGTIKDEEPPEEATQLSLF
ncbi:MAG: uracil-DNA glycosylase [Anaerolineae bacterium]|nr:uracil-DNA glycosylase [Anaerolineae bacterium]